MTERDETAARRDAMITSLAEIWEGAHLTFITGDFAAARDVLAEWKKDHADVRMVIADYVRVGESRPR